MPFLRAALLRKKAEPLQEEILRPPVVIEEQPEPEEDLEPTKIEELHRLIDEKTEQAELHDVETASVEELQPDVLPEEPPQESEEPSIVETEIIPEAETLPEEAEVIPEPEEVSEPEQTEEPEAENNADEITGAVEIVQVPEDNGDSPDVLEVQEETSEPEIEETEDNGASSEIEGEVQPEVQEEAELEPEPEPEDVAPEETLPDIETVQQEEQSEPETLTGGQEPSPEDTQSAPEDLMPETETSQEEVQEQEEAREEPQEEVTEELQPETQESAAVEIAEEPVPETEQATQDTEAVTPEEQEDVRDDEAVFDENSLLDETPQELPEDTQPEPVQEEAQEQEHDVQQPAEQSEQEPVSHKDYSGSQLDYDFTSGERYVDKVSTKTEFDKMLDELAAISKDLLSWETEKFAKKYTDKFQDGDDTPMADARKFEAFLGGYITNAAMTLYDLGYRDAAIKQLEQAKSILEARKKLEDETSAIKSRVEEQNDAVDLSDILGLFGDG